MTGSNEVAEHLRGLAERLGKLVGLERHLVRVVADAAHPGPAD